MTHGCHRWNRAKASVGKRERELAAWRRKGRKRRRRERLARDAEVTAEHGERGHGACGRKTRYSSRVHAEMVARSLAARCGATLSTYECSYCGGWHLTHREQGDA